MNWLSFLNRRRAAPADQLRNTIAAEQDAALARRRAGRAGRQAASRKGAATKSRQQLARDPLFNDMIAF